MIRRTLALAAAVTAGPALAQVPADHLPLPGRKLTLPVAVNPDQRKSIVQLQLYISRDQGQTWGLEDAITPDKENLHYEAKEDGVYWVTMQIHFNDGRKTPPSLAKLKPEDIAKYLIDATPPQVKLTAARRDGDDIVVEWAVEDKHPNDAATTVAYKPAGPGALGDWQKVPAEAVSKNAARFRPTSPGPVLVQVTAVDAAGNATPASKEVAGGAVSPVVVPAAANQLGTPLLPAPILPGNGPLAPHTLPASPPPMMPAPATVQPAPVFPSAPAAVPPAPVVPATAPLPQSPAMPAPLPANPPVPTWAPTPVADAGPQPIATSTGNPAPPPPPTATDPTVQHVRFAQFQLAYQLDAGPSGVRQVDLYVTRDDGRTWTKWSQHDGRENPLRVNLSGRGAGSAVDGDYGFKLVSVSGANLSDEVPTAGTGPDVRVHVDTTPPVIRVYPVEADPNTRGALLLRWQAADRNLSETSLVGIDWSDTPTGPWRPVGGPDAAPATASPPRIPNRGTYSWPLPTNLPTHLLYFRFTATDPAGNRSEVVAPQQTVDLVRPRARIQGVVTVSHPAR